MLSFMSNNSKHKRLTVGLLRADKISTQLGFWKHETTIHNKKYTFYISQSAGEYSVILSNPFQMLSTVSTLEESVQVLDNFISRAQMHDMAVLLNENNKPKLVIGR